jgi:hypothetical protein
LLLEGFWRVGMISDDGCRNRLVTITTYLFAIALIFALPLSIIAHNGIRVLFSSDELSEGISEFLLQRGGIREQLLEEIYTSAWLDEISTERSNPFQFLSSQDRIQITQELFPDDWIKAQVTDGFEQIMEWVQTDEPTPKITLDFEPVKQSFAEGRSKTAIEILVNSWPHCSREQELIIRRSLQSDLPLNFDFCRPGGDLFFELVDHLYRMLQEYVKSIPSEIPFLGDPDDSNYRNSLMAMKEQLLRLSFWLRWLRLFPFPLMGLIMTLAIRSWYDLSRWWGIPLSVGSLLGLLIIAVLGGTAPRVINQALVNSDNQPGDIDWLSRAITDILDSIIEGSSANFFMTLIISVGLVGITWAYYRGKAEPKSRLRPEATEVLPEMRENVSPSETPQERGIPSPPPVKPFDPEELADAEDDEPKGAFD